MDDHEFEELIFLFRSYDIKPEYLKENFDCLLGFHSNSSLNYISSKDSRDFKKFYNSKMLPKGNIKMKVKKKRKR